MSRAMKSSGIEWIGEIPRGWEVKKIKYSYYVVNGNGFSELFQGKETGKFPFCKVSDINNNQAFLDSAKNYVDQDDVLQNKYNTVPAYSIIYGKIGEALKKNHRKINHIECIIDNNLQALVSKTGVIIKYSFYLLSIIDMNWFNNTGAIPSINNNTLVNFYIPSLELPEQQAIADYLDRKCELIDSTIEKQKTAIEKLKLYKQSVITEAVTKGLDPNVPMKPSGIEWIGDIPEGWEISKIKHKFTNLDMLRKPVSSENRGSEKCKYDYYGASGVIDKIDKYIFDEPLILIGEDGANLLLRNLPLIYVAKGQYWVNNHAHILKPKEDSHLSYLAYQLELIDLTCFTSGSTQPKLTQENLSIIPTVHPPLPEQQAIADYLDQKCFQIDQSIELKQKLIEKLSNYKKSLIYECVTGKREVGAS